MNKVSIWLEAFRLRTLPLSLSGILIGTALANYYGFCDVKVFVFSILTTLFFQVLSNVANDLGDHIKGADNENRVGPTRATQSGKITAQQMKKAVVVLSLLSAISASLLIFFAAKYFNTSKVFVFATLGCSCILAAITYTMGKKAYGYLGLGDVFVFVFFGLISVIGVFNLYLPVFSFSPLFLAIGFGLLSTAVLNLNNLRDHENDKAVGKNTLVVKIGFTAAKQYHISIIAVAFLSFTVFWMNNLPIGLFSLLPFLLLKKHLIFVHNTNDPKKLDGELKKVAFTTFAIALLGSIVLWLN